MRIRNNLKPTTCNLKPTSGFSLLETMVAISILMITIVGPLSLASKGIVFADYVKDEITGFYLAQEAIEVIRNVRDTNIKNNVDWLAVIKDQCMTVDGLSPAPCSADIWNFDNANHGLEKCSGSIPDCERVLVADVGGNENRVRLYGHDFKLNILNGQTPTPSIFSRKITVRNVTQNYINNPNILPSEHEWLQLDPSGIDEINVTVEVSWLRGSISRKVSVSENMFSI